MLVVRLDQAGMLAQCVDVARGAQGSTALVALPATRGIAFGIRIALHRLDAVMQGTAGPGLRRALASMSAEMADYKRLDKVRADLVNVV